MSDGKKWDASTVGKVTVNKVSEALKALTWLAKSFKELNGTKPDNETPEQFAAVIEADKAERAKPGNMAMVMQTLYGPVEYPEAMAEYEKIGEKHGWKITLKNYKEIIADANEAHARLYPGIPYHDNRRVQSVAEEQNKVRAKLAAERAELEAKRAEIAAKIKAVRPLEAVALIVAELHEDASDLQSDYFNHRTVKTVAIGWRYSKREDFKALRAAAAMFPETADLATAPDDAEHRENYSMGAGNYLKNGSRDSSGWCVKSVDPESHYIDEIAFPASKPGIKIEEAGETVARVGVKSFHSGKVEKHYHTKKSKDMFLFVLNDRIERDQWETLLNDAKTLEGWYSRAWQQTPGGFAFWKEESAIAFGLRADARLCPDKGPGGIEAPQAVTESPEQTDTATAQDVPETPRNAHHVAALRHAANNARGKAVSLRDSGTSRQNWTPRREKIMQGQRYEAFLTDRVAVCLDALADAIENNALPSVLFGRWSFKRVYDYVATWPQVWKGEDGSKPHNFGGWEKWCSMGNKGAEFQAVHKCLMELADEFEQREATPETTAQKEMQKSKENLRAKLTELRGCKIEGFFPTPDELAAKVVQEASIEDGHTVLEPSAGIGSLVDEIRKHTTTARVTVVEPNRRLHEILYEKFLNDSEVVFGEMTIQDYAHRHHVEGYRNFDRIVMNPPFEHRQDVDHAKICYGLLKPGGVMVCIASAGSKEDMQERLIERVQEDGGSADYFEEADAFSKADAFRRTGVNVIVWTIRKGHGVEKVYDHADAPDIEEAESGTISDESHTLEAGAKVGNAVREFFGPGVVLG